MHPDIKFSSSILYYEKELQSRGQESAKLYSRGKKMKIKIERCAIGRAWNRLIRDYPLGTGCITGSSHGNALIARESSIESWRLKIAGVVTMERSIPNAPSSWNGGERQLNLVQSTITPRRDKDPSTYSDSGLVEAELWCPRGERVETIRHLEITLSKQTNAARYMRPCFFRHSWIL